MANSCDFGRRSPALRWQQKKKNKKTTNDANTPILLHVIHLAMMKLKPQIPDTQFPESPATEDQLLIRT